MKIKTKKQMNLLELIQGVWEGDVKVGERKSDYGNTVFIWSQGFETYKGARIQCDEVFTVEVEEELTEDTEFEELWESYWDSEDSRMMTRSMSARFRIGDDVVSINGIKSTNGDISKTVAIFYKDTLIWSAEHGIPESGVLEVVEF